MVLPYIDSKRTLKIVVHVLWLIMLCHNNTFSITLFHRVQLCDHKVLSCMHMHPVGDIIQGLTTFASILMLCTLQWLTVEDRIKYKILLYVYKPLNNQAPEYLTDILKLYNASNSTEDSRRRLRSSSDATRLAITSFRHGFQK